MFNLVIAYEDTVCYATEGEVIQKEDCVVIYDVDGNVMTNVLDLNVNNSIVLQVESLPEGYMNGQFTIDPVTKEMTHK